MLSSPTDWSSASLMAMMGEKLIPVRHMENECLSWHVKITKLDLSLPVMIALDLF